MGSRTDPSEGEAVVAPCHMSPAAELQRVCRARKRTGAKLMRGDLSGEAVDVLIAQGWVDQEEIGDPVKLGKAVADMADCWLRGTLRAR